MRTILSLLALAGLPMFGSLRAADVPRLEKPNLVFIMADDLGWRDLGCFGSTFHRTPHLDKLAARGVKFTQAYAANPLCSPTRSSVLTGLFPARTGITAPVCHLPQVILEKRLAKGNPKTPVLVAESVTRLKTDYTTLPEVLRGAGYRTGHFGKWHLGKEPYSPLQHGFEVDFPAWPGPGPAGSYVAPWKYPPALKVEGKPGEHIEDTLSGQVVKFIRENKDRPFFVNYWQFSVHAPYDAKDELVAKYRPLADPKNPQHNPVYAAMVESLDAGIGRVMAALEETGLLDKTIIVFFSDNGGVSWAGKDSDGAHKSARFQADMTSPPTSNLPLRNGKASLYEGGVREPCIVVWPGVTKPGTSNDTLIQSIDWMPTLLDMAGVPLPAQAKPDGVSLAPMLKGGKLERDTLFTHFPHDTPASGQKPGASVRRGDMKLIRLFAQNDDGSDQFELYDLKTDLGETKNLAAEKPELVHELAALLDGFLEDTAAVIPKRNPAYKAAAAPAKAAPAPAPKEQAKAQTGMSASPSQPNILFFFVDDWGRNASCYRDPARPDVNEVIETPNIDRVAREGVLFRNAFMGVSSCGPSRASIATGSYFWRCGKRAFLQPDPGWEVHKTPDPGLALPGFGQMLRQAGYATSSSGKVLDADWFPGLRIPLGGDALRFGLHAAKAGHGREETMREFEAFTCTVIRRVLASRQPGQPFCHILGPVGPHRPFAKGSGRTLWGIDPDSLRGKLPAFIPDQPQVREDWADTLGEVLALDFVVGVILDELSKAGELDQTMLVLSGDNGINMPRGKAQCYDLAVRAPLLIRWSAGISKPGRVVDDFVGQIDLAPTWLAAAGITPPATMDGRSLLPLLKSEKSGTIDPSRDHVIVGRERHESATRPDRSPYPMRAIRTDDFLYIRNFKPERWPSGNAYTSAGPKGDPNPQGSGTVAWLVEHRDEPVIKPIYDLIYSIRPAEELYDLKNDPDQMRNLAADPTFDAEKTRLSAKLMAVLDKTNDPRLTDAFDRPPYVTDTPASAPGAKKRKAPKAAPKAATKANF